jgi:hypothetical protein
MTRISSCLVDVDGSRRATEEYVSYLKDSACEIAVGASEWTVAVVVGWWLVKAAGGHSSAGGVGDG